MKLALCALVLASCMSSAGGPSGGAGGGGGGKGDGGSSDQTWTIPSLYSGWWLPNAADGYFNIDSRVRVDVDPGPAVSIFWSTQFWFQGNTAAGYMGIQDGAGPSGKLAIVSIWNATAADPGPGAICGVFDEDGSGYHCTLDYPWVAGHVYRSRLWVVDDQLGLWQSSIMDETTQLEQVLGTLTIPSGLWLDTFVNNFTEDFDENVGLTYSSCSAAPAVSAEFFAPTANALDVSASPAGASIADATCDDVEALVSADSAFAIHQINTAAQLSQPVCNGEPDGLYCGADAILGGDPATLYQCVDGAITFVQTCGACLAGGSGSDRCE